MSILTKCDICGYTYIEDVVPATISRIDITKYSERTGSRYDEHIDCCPKCTEKLREFINVLKSANKIVK